MPKTNFIHKPVRSHRLSQEGVRQLIDLSQHMGRSETEIIEVALDRMYREEIRFSRMFRESTAPENNYQIDSNEENK
jgi:hypothetical protein